MRWGNRDQKLCPHEVAERVAGHDRAEARGYQSLGICCCRGCTGGRADVEAQDGPPSEQAANS
jgi:hypothetical protein